MIEITPAVRATRHFAALVNHECTKAGMGWLAPDLIGSSNLQAARERIAECAEIVAVCQLAGLPAEQGQRWALAGVSLSDVRNLALNHLADQDQDTAVNSHIPLHSAAQPNHGWDHAINRVCTNDPR